MTEDKQYQLDELNASDILSHLVTRVSSMEEHIRREKKQSANLEKENAELRKVAEFGYNKANEWHYVKDGDLPPLNINVLVIHKWSRTPEVGKRITVFTNSSEWVWAMCSDRFRYTSDDKNVIAWKEIVLPEENEKAEIMSVEEQLEYAKTVIQDLLNNSNEYARQRAMDFLEENRKMTDEEPTIPLEELGKVETVKVYTQAYVDKQEKHIEELEKEVLEVRQHLEMTEREWAKDTSKMIYYKTKLSKAKEFFAKWVELFMPKGGNIPPTPIQVDTEQFLKEIKEND